MNSDTSPTPFYFNLVDQKRSVQIIKNVKAEIKKMETLRPSTPIQKNFQNKGALQPISRSSSASSIKSLKYEQEEKCQALHRTLPLVKSEKEVSRNVDIKLEPIVTKPYLCLRKSSSFSHKNKNDTKFSGFPPITYENKLNRTLIKNCKEEFDTQNQGEGLSDKILSTIDTKSKCCRKKESFESSNGTYDCESEGSITSDVFKDSDAIIGVNESDNISEYLRGFFSTLENIIKSGNKKQVTELIFTVQEIHKFLKERDAFLVSFSNRTYLLKLLFKLLDSNAPDLSINIIKILLEMKVRNKNLSNIFKLILKIMKQNNISNLNDQVTALILENLQDISVISDQQATMYGLQILIKLVIFEHLKLELLMKCIATVNHHLSELIHFFSFDSVLDQSCIKIINQVFSILHSITDKERTRKILMESKCAYLALRALHSFHENAEIVQIIVRLISKIIDKEGCEVLTLCSEDLLLNFLHVLEFHKYNIDISLQITFIIGNLVSKDEKTALLFILSPDFINTVINVFDIYVHEHLQFSENVSESFRIVKSIGDRNWHNDIFEVILKILCIWANICLTSKGGYYLASQNILILQLLSTIDAYVEQDAVYEISFVLYSFLVVINNISYYFQKNSDMCISTAERVIPILNVNFSLEVRLEAANIFRNLTRQKEVREFIQSHSLLPEFIKLLNEDDKEFNVVAYGIVMNLLIDQRMHTIFYQEQGLTKVLHKLHLCTERDWKTSAMMCQLLWNYCYSAEITQVPLSTIEVQHLKKFLSYSVYKISEKIKQEDDCYEEWKEEFCPVAEKLLNLLQTKSFENS